MHIKSDGQKIAQEFKLYRKEQGLSQVQLAGKLDISVKTISRIESGNGCSKDILMSFRLLQKNLSSIEVIYDYLKIRIHCSSVETVVSDVLEMDMNEFQILSRRHPGYDSAYEHVQSGILLFYAGVDTDRGVLVEIQGRGCRYYSSLLTKSNCTWLDFFERCLNYGANATRIDIAIDDYIRKLSIPTLIKKFNNKELRTTFKKMDPRNPADAELNSDGATLYIGDNKSDIRWCFYEKDKELLNKKKIACIEDSPVKNRYELRLKHDRANEIFIMITNGTPMESIPFRLLKGRIEFLDKKKDLDKDKWPVNEKWDAFVGDVGQLKLHPRVHVDTGFIDMMRHLSRSYGAKLHAVLRSDNEEGTSYLSDMIKGLSSKQQAEGDRYFKLVIQQHTLANKYSNSVLEMN